MLIFILCLYIIRANGFIVPSAAFYIAWAALFVRWTCKFIVAYTTKKSSRSTAPASAGLCQLFICQ